MSPWKPSTASKSPPRRTNERFWWKSWGEIAATSLWWQIAGGAESIVLPEVETDPETVALDLRDAYERGKAHAIVVVAEGAKYNAEALTAYFREHHERLGFELRVIKLGHVQRGGTAGVSCTGWAFRRDQKWTPWQFPLPPLGDRSIRTAFRAKGAEASETQHLSRR